MAEGLTYATGKRKTAVARVWIGAGEGKVTVNGKTADEYFERETSRMIAKQSLEVLELLDKYDGDEQRARHAYKAHFQMMAYKSAEVRRANREARRAAKPNPGVELIKQLSATLTPEQRAQALEALKAGK